jgi:hypothetical protein
MLHIVHMIMAWLKLYTTADIEAAYQAGVRVGVSLVRGTVDAPRS